MEYFLFILQVHELSTLSRLVQDWRMFLRYFNWHLIRFYFSLNVEIMFLNIYSIWKIKTYDSEIIKWHLFSMTEIWFFVKAVYCKIKRKFFMPLIFVASGSQVYLKCFHSSMQLHSGVIFDFYGHYYTFNSRFIKNSDYTNYHWLHKFFHV